VAFAPHRLVDVQKIDADIYFVSWYKIYGPHMASLYAKNRVFEGLQGPNHDFVPNDCVYKYELGCQNYESFGGFVGMLPYFKYLATEDKALLEVKTLKEMKKIKVTRDDIVKAYKKIVELESLFLGKLYPYLRS